MTREIMFFPNGTTAVFHDGQQVPELQQHPWVALVADLIEKAGGDPTSYRLTMPDGSYARFFRTSDDRWNWRFDETG